MACTRNEALAEQARAAASAGKGQAETARELGVSARWLRTLGIGWPARPGRPRLPDGEGSRATRYRRARGDGPARDTAALRARERELRAAGVPAAEIARVLGVRPETVSRWRRAERAGSGRESPPAT